MNKHNEITLLKQFADSLEEDAYLRHLFTPEMLLWVETQIKADVLPDLHQWYKDEDASHEQTRKDHDKTLEEFEETLSEKDDLIGNLEAGLIAKNRTVEDLRKRLQEALEGWSRDASELDELQDQVAFMEGEIIKYKAKLFDLMMDADLMA